MVSQLISNGVFSPTSDVKQRIDAEPKLQQQNELLLEFIYEEANCDNERVFDVFLKCFYAVHASNQRELAAKVFTGNLHVHLHAVKYRHFILQSVFAPRMNLTVRPIFVDEQ